MSLVPLLRSRIKINIDENTSLLNHNRNILIEITLQKKTKQIGSISKNISKHAAVRV